jgi:2'-5' RNA ligase
MMDTRRVALVAYVRTTVGQFVEALQRELHPKSPDFAAHVTLLPPRCLQGTEDEARNYLKEGCLDLEPFEITLGDVETFIPITPTLFIRVSAGAQKMVEIHNRLNRASLESLEQWPYMPHLTIAKMETEEQARIASLAAQERWKKFTGSRRVTISEFAFVREEKANRWVDVAGFRLGRSVVSC